MIFFKVTARVDLRGINAHDRRPPIASCATQSITMAELTRDAWRKAGFVVDMIEVEDETSVEGA